MGQSLFECRRDGGTYGCIVQSVQEGDAVDVRVGVGGLLLEVLVAGDYFGEVDGEGGNYEVEAEGEDEGGVDEHGFRIGGDVEVMTAGLARGIGFERESCWKLLLNESMRRWV